MVSVENISSRIHGYAFNSVTHDLQAFNNAFDNHLGKPDKLNRMYTALSENVRKDVAGISSPGDLSGTIRLLAAIKAINAADWYVSKATNDASIESFGYAASALTQYHRMVEGQSSTYTTEMAVSDIMGRDKQVSRDQQHCPAEHYLQARIEPMAAVAGIDWRLEVAREQWRLLESSGFTHERLLYMNQRQSPRHFATYMKKPAMDEVLFDEPLDRCMEEDRLVTKDTVAAMNVRWIDSVEKGLAKAEEEAQWRFDNSTKDNGDRWRLSHNLGIVIPDPVLMSPEYKTMVLDRLRINAYDDVYYEAFQHAKSLTRFNYELTHGGNTGCRVSKDVPYIRLCDEYYDMLGAGYIDYLERTIDESAYEIMNCDNPGKLNNVVYVAAANELRRLYSRDGIMNQMKSSDYIPASTRISVIKEAGEQMKRQQEQRRAGYTQPTFGFDVPVSANYAAHSVGGIDYMAVAQQAAKQDQPKKKAPAYVQPMLDVFEHEEAVTNEAESLERREENNAWFNHVWNEDEAARQARSASDDSYGF